MERRLGLRGVLYALWVTKVFAALQFYKVEPLAGKLLALTLTWITAGGATTRTWQLNPDVDTGKLAARADAPSQVEHSSGGFKGGNMINMGVETR